MLLPSDRRKDAVVVIVRDGQRRVVTVSAMTGDRESGGEEAFTVLCWVDLDASRAKIADLPGSSKARCLL